MVRRWSPSFLACLVIALVSGVIHREGDKVTKQIDEHNAIVGWSQLALIYSSQDETGCTCADGGVLALPDKDTPFARIHTFHPLNESKKVPVDVGGTKAVYYDRINASLSTPGSNRHTHAQVFELDTAFCIQACWKDESWMEKWKAL